MPQLTNSNEFPGYPFLTLLISGGHTMVALAISCRSFKILASTVDIAIGNAFDKAARLLQIAPDPTRGYGAALESFCRQDYVVSHPPSKGRNSYPPLVYSLPNPKQSDLFSFTGLTAAVQRLTESQELTDGDRWTIAGAFQTAAFHQLELRLKGSIEWCRTNSIAPVSLVVSGGVASNETLRQR
jgi:N6-L-threonylcarbamoyladenine synthase